MVGRAPSKATAPKKGMAPDTDRGPSYAFSEVMETPVGAMGEALVTTKPAPLDAARAAGPNPLPNGTAHADSYKPIGAMVSHGAAIGATVSHGAAIGAHCPQPAPMNCAEMVCEKLLE